MPEATIALMHDRNDDRERAWPPSRVRLPLRFDAAALAAEARSLAADAWRAHFNAPYHNGGWTGIALRGRSDDPSCLYVGPLHGTAAEPSVETSVLQRCPALAQALATLRCPVRAARLLRLAPGGMIDEHRDHDLSFAQGDVRLHIVLATDPQVEFYVDGERVVMAAGECWYLDLSRPHRVSNRGATDRIHLVVDVGVDDWLRAQIEAGDVPVRDAIHGGADAFARFRERVFADPALAARLRSEPERGAFVALTVAVGRAEGYEFDAADVRAAMAAGQRRWIEQWLV
ncbi:MAG TPA: aspartyl/asparaginyl beta-hydroxylase domain-containing protein [Casimicrobiaceae bacterium]|jgi:quercetin dioxygenase-like cupin family protein